MIFFINRFTIEAFGLAVAVREFASVLPSARLAAREIDAELVAGTALSPVSPLAALFGRDHVWHINDMFSPLCIVMALLGLLTGRQVIICPHGMLDRWALRNGRFGMKLRILAIINGLARVGRLSVHALTPMEQRKTRLLLSNARSHEVVPNGVPADILRLQAKASGHRAAKEGPIVIGAFSRISRKKNQIAIVALAEALRDTRPEVFERVVFRIDGQVEDAAYLAEIEAAIDAVDLGGVITLGGAIPFEERGALLMGYDIFFFPSKSEGMPYVILEAMALGAVPFAAHTASCGFTEPYGAVIYTSVEAAAAALPEDRTALEAVQIDRTRFLEEFGDAKLRRFLTAYEV